MAPDSHRFQALTDALAANPVERRHILADLNDFIAGLGANELLRATADAPSAQLDPYMANYVAAMVETAASRKGVTPPPWTALVTPLAEPVFGSELMSLRLHLLTASPPAFRRRKICDDWRSPMTASRCRKRTYS